MIGFQPRDTRQTPARRRVGASGASFVRGGFGNKIALAMADGRSAPGELMLLGRRDECAVLDGLLEGARAGRSGVLVVRGEAGIGKTALLDNAIGVASELMVLRTVGVESEMELAFAALHRLCAPLVDRLDRLPGPQRDALLTTFGLRAGSVPDRFLVGLAVLSLLSDAAEERPLLCVVDDSQWLDRASAQALAFVARRLLAESVVMLFAARERSDEFAGLPELVVEGLGDFDARGLLASVMPGRVDERVADALLAETRGNPLALLELPRGLSPAQLAGGFGLPGALSLQGRIEETFVARLEALPDDAQRLLLVAAAEPTGDPALLWRAAWRLGITRPVLESAESAGLIEVDSRVRFRHPLVRSAVYGAASPSHRRHVHEALAASTDAHVDPDRRAWHLAEAADGPDENVAAELERAAGRAQARGGLAAAAAFLQRAVALTQDPARRAQRALVGAQTSLRAGTFDAAERLMGIAATGPLDDLQNARLDLVRAQLAFVSSRGNDASPLLLQAAKQLESLDVELARETYLEAMAAAMFAGRLASSGGGTPDIARAAHARPRPAQPPQVADLLLDGLAALHSEGYAAGAPTLQRALVGFTQGLPGAEDLRVLWLACVSALHLWDDERWDVLSKRHVYLAREAGALSELPIALSSRTYMHLFMGELTAARALVEEMNFAMEVTGSDLTPYGAIGVAAFAGLEQRAQALLDASNADAEQRGEGVGISVTHWAEALLNNGLGRYEEALSAAQMASDFPGDLGTSNWGIVELIEAGARSGTPEKVTDAHRRLVEMANVTGTNWAIGAAARSTALLTEGEAAESSYREAIDRLGKTRLRPEIGRARLLYGEWLRREHRRLDARVQLRAACGLFTSIGMHAFAERARKALAATGEKARKRTVETRLDLTAQERQIAQLARDGLSNAEIGSRLFISQHTVAYHLRKVFNKLGLTSRNQLNDALPGGATANVTA
jgi:DNA-binding CsgD family transcriptional regulator